MHIVWRLVAFEFVAAFAAVTALIYLLDPLARKLGLLDHPGGRKDHAAPTPVTGGVAIAIGTILPALALVSPSLQLIGLGLAAVILVTIGVLDDLYDLPWPIRVLAQVAAALAIIYVGGVRVENIGAAFGLGHLALGWLSVPFSVVAVVGLINALNMADGIDGLCGSLALCALVMLMAASVYAGNLDLAHGMVVISGAVVAFLAFNLRTPWRKRAQVFLGNSGSAYLGLIIAWAAFRLTQNPLYPVTPVLAPFLVAPPVIDTLALIARRAMAGHSPFHADRTHVHHLMLDGGFTPTGVVLTLSALSLVLGGGAALALLADVPDPLFIAVYLALIVGWLALTRRHERAVALFKWLSRLTPARKAD
ncbi:UDP-GlcNAc:undecaprenyl-phosphate GlcNAc-1-phosphate transferase [Caulobacter ginsengisoli]|uniref:UDP-GlcNAc:undecaprenyl-phosphate GlcNAc-1-phosphate transferase n=1 Tax=Caulobacter ginsengisoli TaxID=400775 RepID=A0ABU0IVZ9_9CAUL|nr:MraY family glycosyltransferase [Caulobacter ginsengisoli]MDQ0466177.1 UDP-GlcNAc:undecaprenyl-phosphate GlcNAc-1-phosphate transferase [Caulobacter ginsengisoli]